MVVLGLDTTGRLGSVALVRDATTLAVFAGDPARPHAERLPGDILQLLDRHGLRAADVDLFAVASGPGSFTGLRIGIAAIQGLAYATGRPAVGVPALEALAHAAGQAPALAACLRIGVWMDAQREEVFAAVYDRTGPGGPWQLSDGPSVDRPRAVADRWRDYAGSAPLPVVGDGALRYQTVLAEMPGAGAVAVEPPPMATSVAILGWERAVAGGAGLPHAIRPLYVRRSDAELARSRAGATP